MRMLPVVTLICAALLSAKAHAAGSAIEYKDGDTVLEGYFARSTKPGLAPVVLIVHQWKGLGAHEKQAADALSRLGFNAFAVDMYGKGIRPQDIGTAGKLATQYKSDTDLALRRMNAALDLVRSMSGVAPGQVAIMGYCFGGTVALELARSGADIKAAVSFHGGLATPRPVRQPGVIKASLLVHQGEDDPMVSQKERDDFMQEMKTADADLVFVSHANAVHSFTEKTAGDDPSKGVAYNANADQRSWAWTVEFLKTALKAKSAE